MPSAVELVLGRPRIVLKGPPDRNGDRPTIPAPTAADLHGKGADWFLDYPGNPYDPGCTYERDANALGQGDPPVAYAHIVTQPDAPGRLALQYWFYYYFNQFNDLHEGDWELIQLVFAADTPAQALRQEPISVGYSQHDGGERTTWEGGALEHEGTHPVVYPAAGSHANYFSSELWLGRSAKEGFGCDDTTGPSRRVTPQARLVRDPAGPGDPYAWLAFEGNWGQRASGLFNGPSGPNTNKKWARPIDWDAGLRDSSIAVPSDETLGLSVTGFFCDVVASGSRVYAEALDSPLATSLTLLVAGLLVAGSTRLTRWSPVERSPIVAPRAGGQVVRAAGRVFRHRMALFVRMGLIFVPIAALGSAIQAGLLTPAPIRGLTEFGGGEATLSVPLMPLIGAAVALVAHVALTAATAEALRRDEAGAPAGALAAYRALVPRWRSLLGATARATGIVLLLLVSIVGIPWAIRQAVRWIFIPQVCILEGLPAKECLRRSSELVRGRWWRTAVLVWLLIVTPLVTGALVGIVLLFVTTAGLPLVNFLGALVFVIAWPYVAVALTLAYGDRVARPASPRWRLWRRKPDA